MIEVTVDLLKEFNVWLRYQDLSSKSIITYSSSMQTIFNQLNGENVIIHLMNRKLANRRNKIFVFKRYLVFLSEEKYISLEESLKWKSKFKAVPLGRPKNIAFYPKNTWRAIRSRFKTDVGNFGCWFALNFYVRVGELCGLMVSDIDLVKKEIIIRSNDSFTTKGMKERVLPISDKQVVIINNYLLFRKTQGVKHDFLLFNRSKAKLTIRSFQRFCENAGVRAHDLRRSSLTDYVQQGGDIREAQYLAGHSSLTITEKYLDFSNETMLSRIRKRLD